MGGKFSQDKGKRFERWFANKLGDALGRKVYRTQQSRGGTTEGSDVVSEPFSCELKSYAKLGGLIMRALKQSEKDCKPGYIPVAICKGNRGRPVATMYLDDWLDFVQEWKERGE